MKQIEWFIFAHLLFFLFPCQTLNVDDFKMYFELKSPMIQLFYKCQPCTKFMSFALNNCLKSGMGVWINFISIPPNMTRFPFIMANMVLYTILPN